MAEQFLEQKSANILIVDDEFEIREMIADYLRDSLGYNVLNAENGCDALEILKSNHIHLILSDINMPGMKGFDLLKDVKRAIPFNKENSYYCIQCGRLSGISIKI